MLAVDNLNGSRSAQTIALGKFQRKIDATKAFSSDTPAGAAMRGIASALALAGAAFSLQKAINDPDGLNVVKAGVDSASAVQKTADLLRSLGVKNSVVRGVGGGWTIALNTGAKIGAGELLTLATAMIDGYKAVGYFRKGDIAEGALSAGIATGGVIAMLPAILGTGSVAGPVGIAVMTAFFVGQMVWQDAKHIHDGEDDVRTGLIILGYKPHYAAILCKRGAYGSGNASGKGQMLALMNYAKSRDMDAAVLRDWINGLTFTQVLRLSDVVLHEIGVGNGNLLSDPEEAKKLSPYVIAPGAGALRSGFPASSGLGRAGVRRRMAADFEAALLDKGIQLF